MLVSTIDYNDYVGRIGVGRIERGRIEAGQMAIRCVYDSAFVSAPARLAGLFEFDGLKRVNAESAEVGDIVAVSGFTDLLIGDTICPPAMAEPLPFVKIDEPTISMTFCVNDSPFAGTEGTYVTSRHLRARLEKEALTDVSLRVEETESTDAFRVYGRGELHLSILIENMRRQGYEFAVTKPVVLYKDIDGQKCEPMERLVCDVPTEYSGAVIDKIGRRRGTLLSMNGEGRMRLEFIVPSRGLFGYRSEFLTDTRGEGVMSAVFEDYEPVKGDIPTRNVGALVAWEDGISTSYALFNIQDRGELFIEPGVKVYNGMIIGRNSRPGDIDVNVCKKKHMTNSRNSAAAEEALKITGVHRKRILGTEARKKLEARKKNG